MTTKTANPRILETLVPARFPENGPVFALIFGEAPGPRGADKSCHPWWGDEAGKLVFKGLHRAGHFTSVTVSSGDGGLFECAREMMPIESFESSTVLFPWSGKRFAKEGILPVLDGVALSNAWAVCPTGDGTKFHRPTNRQMASAANVARVHQELQEALSRAPEGTLKVIALGTASAWLLGEHLRVQDEAGVSLACLPHPSPQGILAWRKKIGNNHSVPQVREMWISALLEGLGRS